MRGLISTFPPREISQAMQNKLTFSFPQFAISREWNWNCTRLLVVFSGMHSGSQNLIYCVCCWEWARKSYPSAKIRISISLVLKFVVKRGSWVRGAYILALFPLWSLRESKTQTALGMQLSLVGATWTVMKMVQMPRAMRISSRGVLESRELILQLVTFLI